MTQRISRESRDAQIERDHGHCADLLMHGYGISKRHRTALCYEIARVWKDDEVFHWNILTKVREAKPNMGVDSLIGYVRKYKTRELPGQKNTQ